MTHVSFRSRCLSLVGLVAVTFLNAGPSLAEDHVSSPTPPRSKSEKAKKSEAKEEKRKAFPKNFDDLIKSVKEPVSMTLDAADKAENNKKFSMGGQDDQFKNSLVSLKEYRTKLNACKSDEAAGKLSSLLDEYVEKLTESIKSEATADNANATEPFSGFVRNILNPRKDKTHHVSEKVVNTYTLQIKKLLNEKKSKFDSSKETFETSDSKADEALGKLAGTLTGGNFREDIFDEEKAKSDASTSGIVKKTDEAIRSFKTETCKLDDVKKDLAENDTKDSKEEEKEEDKNDKALDIDTSRFDREDEPERKDKKEEEKPANPVADNKPKNSDLPFPYPTASSASLPDFFPPSANDTEELDALKNALKELGQELAALKGLEKEIPRIPEEKEQKSGLEGLLNGLGQEPKKGGNPQSGSSSPMQMGQAKEPEEKKLNVEAPKFDPRMNQATAPVQMPQLPPTQSASSSSASDTSKFSIDSDSRPKSLPATMNPQAAASLEMLQLNQQLANAAQQQSVANQGVSNVNRLMGAGGSRGVPLRGGGYTTRGGNPTRTQPPKK